MIRAVVVEYYPSVIVLFPNGLDAKTGRFGIRLTMRRVDLYGQR